MTKKNDTTAVLSDASLADLERAWRIVWDGDTYAVRRVGLLKDGRAVLLGATGPDLENVDCSKLRELLEELGTTSDAMMIESRELLTPEFYANTRFVVQLRHYWSDYPTYTDLCGENELPLGFKDRASAQAHINAIEDAEYAEKLRQYEAAKVLIDADNEIYEARKAALIAAGLWRDGVLSRSARSHRGAPQRGTSEDWRVVPLEESEWALG